MKLYLRILRFVRPHAGLFGLSVAAMVAFSALDAASFTLLIPFLSLLFRGDKAVAGAATWSSACWTTRWATWCATRRPWWPCATWCSRCS